MSTPIPNKSLLRKRMSRLAAVQALYSEALIERQTVPALLAAQLLQTWADSRTHDTTDLPHQIQPEAALLNRLIETAQTHAARIEAAIDGLILANWSKTRTSLPLLSVLRCFAAEMIAHPERHVAVLIEEYTEVASQLVTDEELQYAHKAFNVLVERMRG